MKSSKTNRGHRSGNGRGRSHKSGADLAKYLRYELDKYYRSRHESLKK